MLSFLSNVFAFLLALGLLIAIHEFGHFFVARLCGVKVLRFSIGFGKVLFSRKDSHGTQFALAAFPIGGYIKMLDEREGKVLPAELGFAFNRKPVWQRILIVLAGPVANFLLAILFFWVLFMVGVKGYAPYIDKIIPESIAARAQLPAGSEIVAIDGQSVSTWRDVTLAMVKRMGDTDSLQIMVRPHGQSDPKSYRLDLSAWQHQDNQNDHITKSLGISLGAPLVPALIGGIEQGGPASKAGLRAGDLLTAIDNVQLTNWFELVSIVRSKPLQELNVEFLRNDIPLETKLTPAKENKTGIGNVGYIGAQLSKDVWPSDYVRVQSYPPIAAIGRACKETWVLTSLTFELLYKMVVGRADFSNISGPITIAKEAGHSARGGVQYFLAFLALISVSLGVINLLPIPLLDGGHLLFYLIEVVRRKPVSENFQQIGTTIGFGIIFFVMVLALYNDFARL